MNDNMEAVIKTVLDVWDPLMLFPLAPDDEYNRETEKIIKYINHSEIAVENLSEYIYDVYKSSFGSHFDYLNSDCIWIARKIMNILK